MLNFLELNLPKTVTCMRIVPTGHPSARNLWQISRISTVFLDVSSHWFWLFFQRNPQKIWISLHIFPLSSHFSLISPLFSPIFPEKISENPGNSCENGRIHRLLRPDSALRTHFYRFDFSGFCLQFPQIQWSVLASSQWTVWEIGKRFAIGFWKNVEFCRGKTTDNWLWMTENMGKKRRRLWNWELLKGENSCELKKTKISQYIDLLNLNVISVLLHLIDLSVFILIPSLSLHLS